MSLRSMASQFLVLRYLSALGAPLVVAAVASPGLAGPIACPAAAGVVNGPVWTAESNQASTGFSRGLSDAGDVNGDGFADVIMGCSYYDNGLGARGRAYVYLGSASGLPLAPSWTADASSIDGQFGFSVSGAGDVNGDGFDDVIVGAYTSSNGQVREGRAYVYLGSSTGLAAAASWTAESDQAEAYFGQSVSGAGDVNGDGYDDVIIGAPGFDDGTGLGGRAYVYLGSSSGLAGTPVWTADASSGSTFGFSVSGAGDVDGDGYDDVIVGDPAFYPGQGRAFVYLGSASGPAASAAWTVTGVQNSAAYGYCVSDAGDVNADGFGDVIVGARTYDNGQFNEGQAYVYLGSGSGLSTSPIWTGEPDVADSLFGESVSGLGDINCDGFGDIIVGAYLLDNGAFNEGRAYVYLGTATGVSATATWTDEGNQISAFFGTTVSGAGDVNGDGSNDILVGALNYDNGEQDEGRAFLYYGACGSGIHTYGTSKINSLGCSPAIRWTGLASATAGSGFVVSGSEMLNNKPCLLFYGNHGQAANPFQGGTLCVAPPIRRTVTTSTGGNPPPNDCSGAPSLDMNAFAVGALGGFPAAFLSIPGTVVNCQWWGRDPGFPAPNNTSLSDALEYTIEP